MEQMRKGNDLNRGLKLGRPELGPLHTTRDPEHASGQEEETLV